MDIQIKDFDKFCSDMLAMNDKLTQKAGWKGIVHRKVDVEGVLYIRAEEDSVSLCSYDRRTGSDKVYSTVNRVSPGVVVASNFPLSSCTDEHTLRDAFSSQVLGEDNVSQLRFRSCGCVEAIPVVLDNTFEGGRKIFCYPKDREDISKALLVEEKGSFCMSVSLNDTYEKCSKEHVQMGTCSEEGNTVDKTFVLFDGKKIIPGYMANVLSGRKSARQAKMTRYALDLARLSATKCRREMMKELCGEDSDAKIQFANAKFPRVGVDNVVLYNGFEKPYRCLYMDTAGYINVTDGQGMFEMPQRAAFHDVELENLLNSTSKQDIRRGVEIFSIRYMSYCLEKNNIESARYDIGDQMQSILSSEEKNRSVSSGVGLR